MTTYIGTCGFCGRGGFRVSGGTLSSHGYEIVNQWHGRDGQRTESCPGSGEEPVESSPRTLEMLRGALGSSLVRAKEGLAAVKKASAFSHEDRHGRQTVVRDPERVKAMREQRIEGFEREIEMLRASIVDTERALSEWAPRKMRTAAEYDREVEREKHSVKRGVERARMEKWLQKVESKMRLLEKKQKKVSAAKDKYEFSDSVRHLFEALQNLSVEVHSGYKSFGEEALRQPMVESALLILALPENAKGRYFDEMRDSRVEETVEALHDNRVGIQDFKILWSHLHPVLDAAIKDTPLETEAKPRAKRPRVISIRKDPYWMSFQMLKDDFWMIVRGPSTSQEVLVDTGEGPFFLSGGLGQLLEPVPYEPEDTSVVLFSSEEEAKRFAKDVASNLP